MMELLDINGKVLFSANAATLRELVEAAVQARVGLRGANLYGANLYGANLVGACLRGAYLYGADLYGANLVGACLDGANLVGAYLRGASLGGADLQGADLYGANLVGAYLRGAYLYGADLRGASLGDLVLGWTSHWLISEILWRAAGDDLERQRFAAWVGRRTDWCWDQWRDHQHPCREWALEELRKWVRDGDDAPEWLRATEAKEE